jgi:uncharacterized protein (DUF2062 family)
MRFSRPVAVFAATLTALSLGAGAAAAQTRAGSPAPKDATAVSLTTQMDADEMRRALETVLQQYPPSLPRILRMDPTLLNNDVYLQPYPQLAAFLKQHAEVAHNPTYFFGAFGDDGRVFRETPQDRAVNMWKDAIQGFTIGAVILGIFTGVVWLIKTLIEHRRWSRLSKIQTEVHNKVLDRMQSNEDLLAYIQTPAGRRFLESAPIPTESPRAIGAPLGRILWSAQAGAVLTVLGLGIEVVSAKAVEDVAPPLAAMGAVVMALGIGFLVSAVLAYMLTRRFGLMNDPGAAAPESRG